MFSLYRWFHFSVDIMFFFLQQNEWIFLIWSYVKKPWPYECAGYFVASYTIDKPAFGRASMIVCDIILVRISELTGRVRIVLHFVAHTFYRSISQHKNLYASEIYHVLSVLRKVRQLLRGFCWLIDFIHSSSFDLLFNRLVRLIDVRRNKSILNFETGRE